MECQNIINLLDNKPNQISKFTFKTWVEINDDLRETYNTNSQIKFKTLILKSRLRDYSDSYILVSGNIIFVVGVTDGEARAAKKKNDNNNKQVIF